MIGDLLTIHPIIAASAIILKMVWISRRFVHDVEPCSRGKEHGIMPDMLVPLYNLPSAEPAVEVVRQKGITIRRANAWEITQTREFITRTFSVGWADEATVGFSRTPMSTFLAVRDGVIVGFGCYECTRKAFFGPTGVEEPARKQGIGAALLLRCLEGLRDLGYAYAIIGGAGPTAFYEKACGAITIPNSVPGVYTNLLKRR